MTDDGKLHWYAARTRFGQEVGIKEKLDAMEVENFIPTERRKNSRGRVVTRALISNLVFLRADKVSALDLVNFKGLPLNYIVDCATHTLLVVPDKNMDDFIRVFDMSVTEGGVLESGIAPGQKVMVTKGALKGVEGTVLEDKSRTYVVVGLAGFVYAKASVPKAWLEIV